MLSIIIIMIIIVTIIFINESYGQKWCTFFDKGVTLTTMKNILEEMMTLFPDQFFHLGLDEVTTSTLCSLQSRFNLITES